MVDILVDEEELYRRLSLRVRKTIIWRFGSAKLIITEKKVSRFLAKMKEKGLKVYEVDGNGDEKTVNQKRRILALVEAEKSQN